MKPPVHTMVWGALTSTVAPSPSTRRTPTTAPSLTSRLVTSQPQRHSAPAASIMPCRYSARSGPLTMYTWPPQLRTPISLGSASFSKGNMSGVPASMMRSMPGPEARNTLRRALALDW